ncbi:hypothetical protein PWT90_08758 [Aphanocladium album]|nr:hypothetical protein PWT90_08758 [Aphanocladium album]
MAYNDDAVLARLSALNESHDSIATAAQWIMFHKRHADRTVALWMQRLKDSSATRRLSLIYLANEVAQQSRIRRKEDFIIAFSPIIAEATALAYKGAPTEIHGKLRRVIDVWKDRNIFEAPIQNAIESRLDELDKAKGAPRPGFGNSPFTSNTAAAPPEFVPLISGLRKVQKLSAPLKPTLDSANQEYEKQTDASTVVPSAPVFAARLNGLLKTLSNAESSVSESIAARESLIAGLEKMLQEHKMELEADSKVLSQLSERKTEIEEKKQQVELAIMRALGPADGNGTETHGEDGAAQEPGRPEMEALTPPAMEEFTPPPPETESLSPVGDAGVENEADQALIGASSHSVPISSNGSNKRRRIDDEPEIPDMGADDGIDEDVAEMLKGEGPQ